MKRADPPLVRLGRGEITREEFGKLVARPDSPTLKSAKAWLKKAQAEQAKSTGGE